MKDDKREQLLDDINDYSIELDDLKTRRHYLQRQLQFAISEEKACRETLVSAENALDLLENESTINESGGKY